MMLRYMNFRGVCVQQESTCATFGAGTSMACVVDIGAQKTSVSCVEDGLCIPDSR
jgi:actin-related protein 8